MSSILPTFISRKFTCGLYQTSLGARLSDKTYGSDTLGDFDESTVINEASRTM